MSRNPTSQPQRITIAEAALVLGVSKETVKRRVASGEIPHDRIGRGPKAPIRLRVADVEAYARPGRPADAPRTDDEKRLARSAAANGA